MPYEITRIHYVALGIGGAIAGAIAGNRFRVLLGSAIGMALGTVFLATTYPGGLVAAVALLSAAPAGALIGILFQGRDAGR